MKMGNIVDEWNILYHRWNEQQEEKQKENEKNKKWNQIKL